MMEPWRSHCPPGGRVMVIVFRTGEKNFPFRVASSVPDASVTVSSFLMPVGVPRTRAEATGIRPRSPGVGEVADGDHRPVCHRRRCAPP